MRLLRSLAFTLWLYGCMALLGLAFLPALLVNPNNGYFPIRLWVRSTLWGLRTIIGAKVQFEGFADLPPGPFLIASKHQSMLDTILPFLRFPKPAVVMKKELMRAPVLGFYSQRIGLIPVDREGGATAMKTMLRMAKQRIAEGRSVLIFPEGTRQPVGAPPDYKPGVAALYRELKAPCLPIALDTGRVWPGRGLDFRPGTITVRALEVIPPGLPRDAFMARLESAIEEACNALPASP